MCFSAQASFTASALLAIIGALSLYKMSSKKYVMCALTPLFFAIQQCAEGILWLTMDNPQYEQLTRTSMYTFIFFAWIIWPTWIPTSLWLIEKNKQRKKLLLIPMGLGVFLSALAIKGLLGTGLIARTVNSHIVYEAASGDWQIMPLLVMYACTVITPFLISSIHKIWLFGLAAFVSLCVSYIVWYEALGSVWCFFAALISASILYFVSEQKK
jgi:hypothetical protein